jgi:1,4-dihydroxy-2-naphthoate octaprenyltransferase
VFVLVPFAISVFLALVYPIAWLTLLALLGALSAILIVWTYRSPRELIVALQVTSFTSVGYGAILFWAFVA